ncbi:MAG TPA: HIT family protein [Methylocystis sp.]|nr:HIT family protein [Methylocystis sp.]
MIEAYDSQNVFAKILRGEAPAYRVYEDDVALAFMDIMPRTEGHTLVIPRRPARGLLDIDAENLGALIKRVQHVAKAVVAAFEADGLTLHQFNESAGGQVVFHIHFHILPRFDGVALRPPGTMGDKNRLQANAEKIKAALTPFTG